MFFSDLVDNIFSVLQRALHVLVDHFCCPVAHLVNQVEVPIEFPMVLRHHFDFRVKRVVVGIFLSCQEQLLLVRRCLSELLAQLVAQAALVARDRCSRVSLGVEQLVRLWRDPLRAVLGIE